MSHPETDQDFRERLIRVVDRHHRADVMIASGRWLDGFGRMYGMARKGLPEGSFADPIVEAFRQVEREMAQSVIEPMAPGERPTKPGLYILRNGKPVELRWGGYGGELCAVEFWAIRI